RSKRDWSSDVCSSDLKHELRQGVARCPADSPGERASQWSNPEMPPGGSPGAGARESTGAPPDAGIPVHAVAEIERPDHRVARKRSEERRVGKECADRG